MFGHAEQRPGPELEAGLFPAENGTDALDKILVGVRRVKLHQPHALLSIGKARRQLPCDVGLAGTGRSLKDDLTLVFQQPLDLAKVTGVDQQFVCEALDVTCCGTRKPVVRVIVQIVVRFLAAEPIQQLKRRGVLHGLPKSVYGRLASPGECDDRHVTRELGCRRLVQPKDVQSAIGRKPVAVVVPVDDADPTSFTLVANEHDIPRPRFVEGVVMADIVRWWAVPTPLRATFRGVDPVVFSEVLPVITVVLIKVRAHLKELPGAGGEPGGVVQVCEKVDFVGQATRKDPSDSTEFVPIPRPCDCSRLPERRNAERKNPGLVK